MNVATVGLDLARNVFQLHAVDAEGRVVLRRRLRRFEVARFFARLPPCLVGMEACAGAHHWARTLAGLGHEVRLMPPAYVKAHVRRQKNDMADAAAICEAVTRPSMRFVPIKSEAQQAMLLIHRARDLPVRQRTGLINALRAHLAELGVVVASGGHHGRRLPAMLLGGETFGMAPPVLAVLLAMARRCQALEAEIAELERELHRRAQADAAARRLLRIPGIGPITATALAATVADAKSFRSGRELAAWLGLVPRQSSSGGHERLGGITKMGHRYLRRLLVVGAQAVLRHAGRRAEAAGPWLGRLLREKPRKVAAVAPGQQDRAHRLGGAGQARSISGRRRLSERARRPSDVRG
jgi:transposase